MPTKTSPRQTLIDYVTAVCDVATGAEISSPDIAQISAAAGRTESQWTADVGTARLRVDRVEEHRRVCERIDYLTRQRVTIPKQVLIASRRAQEAKATMESFDDELLKLTNKSFAIQRDKEKEREKFFKLMAACGLRIGDHKTFVAYGEMLIKLAKEELPFDDQAIDAAEATGRDGIQLATEVELIKSRLGEFADLGQRDYAAEYLEVRDAKQELRARYADAKEDKGAAAEVDNLKSSYEQLRLELRNLQRNQVNQESSFKEFMAATAGSGSDPLDWRNIKLAD